MGLNRALGGSATTRPKADIIPLIVKRLSSLFENTKPLCQIILVLDDEVQELRSALGKQFIPPIAGYIACLREFSSMKPNKGSRISLPALFVIEPTVEKCEKVLQLMQNNFFSSATVHFTQTPEHHVKSKLSENPHITIQNPLNIPFVPKMDNLVLMKDPKIILEHKFSSKFSDNFLKYANKICTLLQVLSSKPKIHYLVKDELSIAFSELIRDKLTEANFEGTNKDDKLLVFIRKNDFYPLFYLSNLYMPAAFEYSFNSNLESIDKSQNILLTNDNTFFHDNNSETASDALNKLKKELDRSENLQGGSKQGLNQQLIEAQIMGAKSKMLSENHHILQKIANGINPKQTFIYAQDEIIKGHYDSDLSSNISSVLSSQGSMTDIARLIAICGIRSKGLTRDLFTNLCQRGPLSKEYIAKLEKLKNLGIDVVSDNASSYKSSDVEALYENNQLIPKMARLASVVSKNRKDTEVAQLDHNSTRKSYKAPVHGHFLKFNTEKTTSKIPRLFICAVGGVTPFEIASIAGQKINDHKVIIVSDRFLVPKDFMDIDIDEL